MNDFYLMPLNVYILLYFFYLFYILRGKMRYLFLPINRSSVKATFVRRFTFLFSRSDKSKMTMLFSLLFYPSVPRHRPSIISAQERNPAVPRRMQSPLRPSSLFETKKRIMAPRLSPANFIRSNAAVFCSLMTNKRRNEQACLHVTDDKNSFQSLSVS